jgi:Arm DNA-binding domain
MYPHETGVPTEVHDDTGSAPIDDDKSKDCPGRALGRWRNLYLQVTAGADDGFRRSWIFRYALAGKEHQAGLGPTHTINLTEARQKATELRKLLYEGKDPLQHRNALRASTAVEAAKATTFRAAAKRLIASKRKGWKNAKHAAQWGSTLETYAYPLIGDLPVQAVDTGLVMKILDPIWSTKTETASRVRSRIEAVIGSAKAYGEYVGENPARWKGNLDAILAKTSDVAVKGNLSCCRFDGHQV